MMVHLMLAGFALGTLGVQCCATLPSVPWLLAVGIAAACAVARPGGGRGGRVVRAACLATAALAFGAGSAAWRADNRMADALPRALEGVDLEVAGVVDGLPTLSDEGVRFVLRNARQATADAHVPSQLALGWYRRGPDDTAPVVHAGECWQLTVRLKRPHGTLNFDGFDLEAWLFERNLRATGVVRAAATTSEPQLCAPVLLDGVSRVREALRDRFLRALGDRPYAGVMVALAIGDQQAIPQAQWRVFNRTGIGHLISISGLHITVFAAMVGALVQLLARRSTWLTSRVPARKVAALIGLAAAAAYTLVSGAEIPAQRTLTMLAVATLGLCIARPGTAFAVWLWALVAVLLVDPWAAVAAGFWLSFGAVGLLLYAGGGRVRPQLPARWHARWCAKLREGAHAQWVITLGLAPLTLALFQQLSTVAPLANALAIPVVTFAVVPLALAAIVLPVDALVLAAHAVFAALMRVLEPLATWPHGAWQQHAPTPAAVVLAMTGIVWLLAPRGVPGRTLGLAWLLPLVLVVPLRPLPGTFDMVALDVGQGLAVLVRTATHQLLFDTGPRYESATDAGARIVVPALRAAGIDALDMLIVSHADSDHSGGALSVLDALPVAAIVSSLDVDNPIVAQMSPGRAQRCRGGQQWTWDGVRFDILYPGAAEYADAAVKTNDRSCVLRIASAQFTALLTGDIEARGERTLLVNASDLAADVLVVPHHGSRTSSSAAFVNAVGPRVALFTTGYRNRFGHPRSDIVARYNAVPAAVLRSDFDGAIRVTHDGEALVLGTARDERRRYWHDDPR